MQTRAAADGWSYRLWRGARSSSCGRGGGCSRGASRPPPATTGPCGNWAWACCTPCTPLPENAHHHRELAEPSPRLRAAGGRRQQQNREGGRPASYLPLQEGLRLHAFGMERSGACQQEAQLVGLFIGTKPFLKAKAAPGALLCSLCSISLSSFAAK